MTIRWPERVLRPQNVAIDIASRSLSGPPSISGSVQVVSSDAGIWKATFGSVVMNARDHVLAWRGIQTLLEGRLGSILVPNCRGYQPVSQVAKDLALYAPVEHSDGAPFADGAGYQGQGVDAKLTASVAARAVSASISVRHAAQLEPSQRFSIGERMYALRSVVYTGTETASIAFRPPLREAAVAGARLNFDDPVCRMRLATDDAMDLELALRRFGSPTVNFVEDV